MKVRLGTLRAYIREAAGGNSYPGQPVTRNALSPDINSREQLGNISAKALDTVDDPDGLPDHLREPQVDPKDCYGPVPPDAEPPGVHMDPYVRDASPKPSGAIKRG